MPETNMREQAAITLALVDDLVSPPHGGRYYRYADAILPLIEEAVTAERERIYTEVRLIPCYGPSPDRMEFDVGEYARSQVLDVIRGGESNG